MTRNLPKDVTWKPKLGLFFGPYLVVSCPLTNKAVSIKKCSPTEPEDRIQENRKYKQCPYYEGESNTYIFCGFEPS